MDKGVGDVVYTDNGPATVQQVDASLSYADEVMYFVVYTTEFGSGWIRASELTRNAGN